MGAATTVERRSIEPIPAEERHGSPRSQFTLWFGANMQITAVVDGALAVVFGADAMWAIIGLLIGNVAGGAVMALHSAQGPRLGLPQMISSRAQFGVLGAALPLVLVIIMYLGFAATGTVLSGQAITKILHVDASWIGIVIFGALTFVVAAFGYRWIHALGRVATVMGILGFAWLTYKLFADYGASTLLGDPQFDGVSFLLAISLGAGWQLTFGPYVADYSRYLPEDTPERTTFLSTFAGSVVGSMWSMTLGALIASVPKNGFLGNQVGFVGDLAGGGAIAFVIYCVIVVGKLTVNTLNAYGGSMTMLTTATGFTRSSVVRPVLRMACVFGFLAASVLVALVASADFLDSFKNFVLVLLMVFTPWSAINLVDYYLVSRERVDVPALFDRHGRYGAWNVPALVTYVVGVVAQIPFLAQELYTGPITDALGGADISWIIGLLLTAAIYYPWAKRTSNPPEQMIRYDDDRVPA
ncbi:purine-cytosine permease family protein [Luteipulveratus halotolerans]|uniref:Sulfonate ABC transporter substrate-binding protein n=1 Tax=Luteipulveratus halotolerans TaxID=1631356 RepID=A0A0L6CL76_9MICO|nr:cytosine permease [Luteipulveratus halotolerans]KNX38459.1 sulfonate ABC transporter substrate-binding protein [Luteipulveratus halotolerans]